MQVCGKKVSGQRWRPAAAGGWRCVKRLAGWDVKFAVGGRWGGSGPDCLWNSTQNLSVRAMHGGCSNSTVLYAPRLHTSRFRSTLSCRQSLASSTAARCNCGPAAGGWVVLPFILIHLPTATVSRWDPQGTNPTRRCPACSCGHLARSSSCCTGHSCAAAAAQLQQLHGCSRRSCACRCPGRPAPGLGASPAWPRGAPAARGRRRRARQSPRSRCCRCAAPGCEPM